MTPAEKLFMDNLIAEANVVKAFKNASGKPLDYTDEQLKAQEQFIIQAEDHFTPDVGILHF